MKPEEIPNDYLYQLRHLLYPFAKPDIDGVSRVVGEDIVYKTYDLFGYTSFANYQNSILHNLDDLEILQDGRSFKSY